MSVLPTLLQYGLLCAAITLSFFQLLLASDMFYVEEVIEQESSI